MLFELFGKIRRFSAYALILGVIGLGTSALLATPVSAATGINQQLNFQGRLLNAQGAVVADGYYNVEFKIYQDGPGTAAGNPGGTLKWTEDWLNNNGNAVRVVNGYISVQLGSITPFGSSVDWNQDTLWLSVNIGNTNATCTPFTSCAGDGEMTPMKRLSAVPYALNTGALNGLTSGQFVQLAQGVQTDASTVSSIFINKTAASGNLVQLQQSGANVFTVTNTGAVALQNTADSTSALSVKNLGGTSLLSVDTTNGQTVLQGVQDTAPLGSELHTPVDLTNAANWTSTGWTTTTTSATHTTGNTSTLQNNNIAITAGNYYQVSFDLSGSCGVSGNGIQAILGGATNPTYGGGIYINWTMCPGSYSYGFKAVDTTKLRIIPTSGWGGTISNISVKQITSFTPTLAMKNASGTTSLEIRTSNITSNQFIGLNSGKYNTTGNNNTANGSGSLAINTSGNNNSAFGASALANNTTGGGNTGVGASSLKNNTSGVSNTATGNNSMSANTSGTQNSAFGESSLVNNTTGSFNTATGPYSLSRNTSGNANTASGASSLGSNTTGTGNTASGSNSLQGNTTGSYNAAVGCYAGYQTGQFQTLNNLQYSTTLGANSQVFASNTLALGGQGSNAVNIGIGTGLPTNRISAESFRYNTGTITTDGTAVIVGTGTTFTSDMVGNVIYIATNSSTTAPYRRTITAYTDATHITVSATVPALTNAQYYINYVGLQMTSTGKLGVNTLNPQYDIDVAGTINASTTILAPSFDTATAMTLSIGTTNATGITLAKNVTVSSGMSLTLAGGATGTRPASTAEGMLYYDTDTKQLLTYANGKWQADRSTATKIVAASNSSQSAKDSADYVTTGTNDQTIINNALTAAAGGKVYLMEGTYTISASISVPNNTTLAGAGAGTVITIPNSFNADINAITNTTTGGNGTGITIQDLRLEGNRTNQTSGTMNGVYFNGVGSGSGSSAVQGGNITGIWSNNWRFYGINLISSRTVNITNNTAQGNSSVGIYLAASSTGNTIANNIAQGGGTGYDFSLATNNTVVGNVALNLAIGFLIQSSSNNNTFTDNSTSGTTSYAITLNANANSNVISNNKLDISGGTTNNNAIYITSSSSNTITGNNITDTSATTNNYAINITDAASNTNYLANNTFSSTPGTSTINDAGTGTVYANQSRAENGGQLTNRTANDTAAFTVQNAAGANVLAVDTTNSKLLVAGAIDTTTGTTLSIGTATATAISIGSAGITTTIAGNTGVTLNGTTGTTQVCRNGSGLLSSCDASYLAPTGSNFIQNTTTQQSNANFYISSNNGTTATGRIRAIGGQTSDLLQLQDSSGAVLSAFGVDGSLRVQNVNVAAGKSLTLAGGATGTRPASTAEGMLYYDTDTKQLLTYANGKWQADRSTATKIVAASNSSQSAKDSADYVTTGTNDQTIINNALTAAAGGKVYLMEGTYTISASISVPNNTTLAGAGAGTVITIPNAFNANLSAIINTDQTTGTGITVQDVHLEGNKVNQSGSGFGMSGISLNNMGGGSGASARQGAKILNVQSNNWYSNSGNNCYNGDGICLYSSSNNTVVGNTTQNNGIYGIYLGASSSNNTITSNTIQGNIYGILLASSSSNTLNNNFTQGNSNSGFYIMSSSNNTINSNTTTGNGIGILLSGSANNTITSNSVRGNSLYGIYLGSGSSNNTLTGSVISGSGGNTTNNAIYIDASNGNTITGNNITDTSATTSNYAINIFNNTSNTNYIADNTFSSTPGTSSINDAGTGTVYANQPRAENGAQLTNRTANDTRAFTVQTTAGTDVFAVDTTNSKVLVAGTLDTTTATTLNIGNASATSIVVGNAAGTAGIGLSSTSITLGSVSAATVMQAATQSAANTAGNALTLAGSTGQGSGNGGVVTIQGGNGGATGLYGGNLTLSGGTGTTSNGTVILATSTFQTATTDTGCFPGGTESSTTTNCTISQNSINNNASVIVGFTNDGQTALMPDPSILTAGRVVYVTASNGSKDFTLSVNGGGQGNQISMRKNTTATMIWNGADWTAAGASSSTTMQAAYDNTLQSAGGAELVVSKTSATNGLTIRDSATNSVNGALLTIQSSSAANLFSVNSNVTEYTTDSGAEVAGASAGTFPANTWSNVNGSGTSTVTRYTTTGNNIATGQGSVSVATTGANDGVKNALATTLTPNMHYNVSFTTRLASGTFTNMAVDYSKDGTTASLTACAANQTSTTSIWTKVNCTFTAPASGITGSNAILIRQATGVVRTFYVDNISITIAADYNLATDGGVDDTANFGTNWTTVSAATVSQSTTVGNDTSDSAQVVTTATAGQGVRNKLSINPLASTLYRITVYAASSNTFNDFTVRYSRDGGTSFVSCADYNTQIISTSTSAFTKVTCYVTTDGTAASNPYVYFTQAAGTARTFYVDTFSMNLSSNSTPNVQVGGGVNGGPTTLFTLDKGASAPIAANNDALLGSMYYDTTLGKLQCYEADGWGACGSSPDNIITISPEYTNAVLHGTGIGTMTSDLCSDYLDINDPTNGPAICGAGETYNFYKWTSPQASDQKYSIYVTYQLPSTFKSFNSGQTSLQARVDSTTNAYVKLQLYKNHSGLTPCGVENTITTAVNTWQAPIASGTADPSTCGFAPGDSVIFKITVGAKTNANAYVGNLNFAFSNK